MKNYIVIYNSFKKNIAKTKMKAYFPLNKIGTKNWSDQDLCYKA